MGVLGLRNGSAVACLSMIQECKLLADGSTFSSLLSDVDLFLSNLISLGESEECDSKYALMSPTLCLLKIFKKVEEGTCDMYEGSLS